MYMSEKGRKLFPESLLIIQRTKISLSGLAPLSLQLNLNFSPGCSIFACSFDIFFFQAISLFEGILPRTHPNCLPNQFLFLLLSQNFLSCGRWLRATAKHSLGLWLLESYRPKDLGRFGTAYDQWLSQAAPKCMTESVIVLISPKCMSLKIISVNPGSELVTLEELAKEHTKLLDKEK